MSMTTNKQALREAAEKATQEQWSHLNGVVYAHTEETEWELFEGYAHRAEDAVFVTSANPKVVLALLDELEAAESGVAELNDALCKLVPGCQYMDPPDGGNVSPLEQVSRMVADYRERMEVAERQNAAMQGKAEPVSQPYKLPEGWVAVPVEPTVAMRKAFHKANDESEQYVSPDHQWGAMLAAAPQQDER